MKPRFYILPLVVFIAIVALVHHKHPERRFFHSWQSAENACDSFCDSYDKDPILTGNGVCVCNTKTGQNVTRKYTTLDIDICTDMCDSSGQEYSQVLQYSAGTCICNNEEGNKVAEGYHKYLNGQCK